MSWAAQHGETKDHEQTLLECLYYAVREDRNCYYDPAWREPDERILPGVDMLAKLSGPEDLSQTEIEAFCRAIHRRGRLEDLQRIPWLRLQVDKEPRLF